MSNAATKEQAHDLIERIDPEQMPVVVELLEKLLDPLTVALENAPFENEEIGPEEELAVGRAKLETGPGTSMEDLLAEYGLTLEELRTMEFPQPDKTAA